MKNGVVCCWTGRTDGEGENACVTTVVSHFLTFHCGATRALVIHVTECHVRVYVTLCAPLQCHCHCHCMSTMCHCVSHEVPLCVPPSATVVRPTCLTDDQSSQHHLVTWSLVHSSSTRHTVTSHRIVTIESRMNIIALEGILHHSPNKLRNTITRCNNDHLSERIPHP